MNEPIVKLVNVSKRFDAKRYVIKNLNLDINENEFLTLLGPSGCGKTTILRMISGLEEVTSGKVFIAGEDVTDVDPTLREVNTIFQNLAIFPHMSVYDNIAFGLRMKKIPEKKIKSMVKKTLQLVELENFDNRMPSQLSGGQLQRVAIARGIIMNPKVLLLDESLCSLDLKLKRSMQVELKKIQKKLGITFIYVTHDQDEALTMSDRIVIINNGIIQQDDTPQNIYLKPNNEFVADFIGESNIIKAIIKKRDGKMALVGICNLDYEIDLDDIPSNVKEINVLVRPENIAISKNVLANSFDGVIIDVIYDGAVTKLVIEANNSIFKVSVYGVVNYKEGEKVYLKIKDGSIVPLRGITDEKK